MSTVPAVEGGSRRSSADAGGTMAGKQAKLRGERDAGCLLPAACCLLCWSHVSYLLVIEGAGLVIYLSRIVQTAET